MRRSAASAELTRQVEKSTPSAYERVSKDDAHLDFFHSALSRRSSLRHRALIKWLLPEPSRTRGFVSALVLLFFVFLLYRSTLALGLGDSGSWQRSEPSLFSSFLRRYGRRSGQPSSSSLARRACVQYSGCSAFYFMTSLVFVPLKFGYWLFLNFACALGLSGGRGEMAMAVASSARLAFLRGAVCACCALRQMLSLFGPCTAMVH